MAAVQFIRIGFSRGFAVSIANRLALVWNRPTGCMVLQGFGRVYFYTRREGWRDITNHSLLIRLTPTGVRG